MKRSAAGRWLTHRNKAVGAAAAAIAPDFFPEQIHQFRVEVKKLRAILRFLHHDGAYKLPRRLRKLYHTAGSIRDYQVQLIQVATEKERDLPVFCVWLGFGMAAASKSWKVAKAARMHQALSDALNQRSAREVQEADFWDKYRDFLHWLNDRMEGDPSEEELHEIRKQAKDMQYIAAFCRSVFPESKREYELVEQGLREIGMLEGVYNDKVSLLAMAYKFQKMHANAMDDGEAGRFKQALKDWEAFKNSAREGLTSSVKGLLSLKVGQQQSGSFNRGN